MTPDGAVPPPPPPRPSPPPPPPPPPRPPAVPVVPALPKLPPPSLPPVVQGVPQVDDTREAASEGSGACEPSDRDEVVPDGAPVFVPLRIDPPPRLYATWWIRYTLFLAQMVGLAVVLLTEYATGPGDVATTPVVVVPYVLVGVLLVTWSGLAMFDAARLVPATRYHPPSRWWVAMTLWVVAFAAPVIAMVTIEWARERFTQDADDIAVVVATVAVVMICFLLVWFPFQYHTRQAHRIGAPGRVVAAWFWVPLLAAVGGLAINALGLHDFLAGGGFTDWDRTVQVAVIFGLPALTFALSTWRATTVFDEVIEIRWLRWRTEWDQTLAAMAAQPAPGPEPTVPTPPHR